MRKNEERTYNTLPGSGTEHAMEFAREEIQCNEYETHLGWFHASTFVKYFTLISQETLDPVLTSNGVIICMVDALRILGVIFQRDDAGLAAVQKLQQTVTQATRLVWRVTNRKHGLKEQDTLSLIQALIISRLAYGTPYIGLKNSERDKLNALIMKIHNLALGLLYDVCKRQLQLRITIHGMN